MSFALKGAGAQRDRSKVDQRYTLYGGRLSYFTQKVDSGMGWHLPDGSWRYCPKQKAANSKELEQRAGTHQIPVLSTPENWVVADSTPIFHMLDARLPQGPRFYPGNAFTQCIVMLMEEYFDVREMDGDCTVPLVQGSVYPKQKTDRDD